MSKKYHVQRREFLNLHTDMRAYVIGIVENTHEKHICCDSKEDRSEITLKIADCSDEIDLWFDLRTVIERENSLHKIRKLAEVVTAVRDAIEIEVRSIEHRAAVQQHTRAASAVH
ncbi:MAG TPA: hypothetical protein VGQ55_05955 [Pyrinomonadaceae bacterium]|jgi:hypothetical protein|nr:hypothetical protein [Pyrinomonadaceae bacterium]